MDAEHCGLSAVSWLSVPHLRQNDRRSPILLVPDSRPHIRDAPRVEVKCTKGSILGSTCSMRADEDTCPVLHAETPPKVVTSNSHDRGAWEKCSLLKCLEPDQLTGLTARHRHQRRQPAPSFIRFSIRASNRTRAKVWPKAPCGQSLLAGDAYGIRFLNFSKSEYALIKRSCSTCFLAGLCHRAQKSSV